MKLGFYGGVFVLALSGAAVFGAFQSIKPLPSAAPAPTMDTATIPTSDAPAALPDRATLHAEIRDYILRNPEVLVEAFEVLEQRQQLAEAQQDAQRVLANADALWNDPNSYVGGNVDGTITIVEFLDYKCGFCKRAHPEMKALLANHDDIRIIRKEFPILGQESILASRAAIAVLLNDGPEVYNDMSDSLMSFGGQITENVLRRFAQRAGADADAMLASMNDVEVSRIIQSNRALGQRLAISGTPSFIFGDRLVRGFLPLDRMEDTVALLRRLEN
jgi:protein-disulfide isomerase